MSASFASPCLTRLPQVSSQENREPKIPEEELLGFGEAAQEDVETCQLTIE